ncbi:putative glycosyl hydrolase [Trypanosoma rangeli]|uniref:Putative glycosyl hydrolase n=1 Tax=Trypanosoma rangeli TaxID=5698 RepID=A0A3R7NRI4_TRYRA|nr:putative glycosyl hydrolase [Trypanosoma rangeli]RNF06595.1 putative glycosyl hydrolase [Trypanosoma rangeli]|eukprot:RNF06595.1 putative glycosyl hydrolase [Trypanosoma rangeli]
MHSPRIHTDLAQHLVGESWELIETVLPQGENAFISESLFSVGNGHVSVRGYAEEAEMAAPYGRNANHGHKYRKRLAEKGGHAKSAAGAHSPEHAFRGTYINGIYEERLLAQNHRRFMVGTCARECFLICVPDAFCVDVFVGSEHVSVATGTILSHRRVLDLRTGELRRRLVWQSTNHGREVTIESSRFVSLSRKNIAALRLSVTAKNVSNTDIRIVSRTVVTADAQRHLKVENIVARHTLVDASTAVSARTRNSCKRLVVAVTETCYSTSTDPSSLQLANFCSINASTPPASTKAENPLASTGRYEVTLASTPQLQQQQSFVSLAPKCAETIDSTETIYTSVINESTTLELTKYIAFFSDEEAAPEDMCDLAVHHSREAAGVTYDTMLNENRNIVEKFWETADVGVKTNQPSVQGAIRFNLLHLCMSFCRAYATESPPRGLMNELDNGLHHWEVDAIVIPFFAHIHPKTARALLQFRIDTLPQARNIAADMYLPRGALYPLRTVSGGENYPLPFCAAFLYSNAVIAYAMQRYVMATNDTALLLQGGADVVFSTVLIWIIWGTWDKGEFHIRYVGGPDEYSGLSDNNLFTNLMAQNHMQWAVQLASEMQEKHPQEWERVKDRCQITDEDLHMIERAASKMVVLFDAKNRVHPGDQFFMRKKKWGFCDVKKKKGFLIQTFDPSVIYRHQVCWTPDVILSSVLLPERFTTDELLADYNFYEPITANDSSLNSMIFSVVASQLGMIDKAMFHFNRALFVDIDNVIENTGGGLHSVAEAGSWWCFTGGFGGMRVLRGVLHFNPILPDEWDEYRFTVRHSGCLVHVHVTRRVVTYKVVEGLKGDSKLIIIHSNTNRIHLQLGIPASVRLYRDVHVFDFDCVVFDMDSIIEDVEDYHYEAWKSALEPFLWDNVGHSFKFTGEIYLAYLKHDRPLPALQRFLAKQGVTNLSLGTPEDSMDQNTIYGLFRRKQYHFRKIVHYRGLRPREGILEFLSELRQSGISVGCVTVSKNGHWLLNEASRGVLMLDGCLDGGDGEKMGLRWRPEMDYFASMCEQLNASPSRTVIVMDGIDGFSKSALEKFKMIVDVAKDPEVVTLAVPCTNISKFSELTVTLLDEKTTRDYSIYGRGTASRRSNLRPANDIWVSFDGGTLET